MTTPEYAGAVKPSSIEHNVHEPDLSATRTIDLRSNQQLRYDEDENGYPTYIGAAPMGLAEGSDGWIINLFSFAATNPKITKKTAYGSWTGRATLSYT